MPQFISEPKLTALAQGLPQEDLVYEQIMPTVPVLSEDFKYTRYDISNGLTLTDDEMGRRGEANEVDWKATQETASVVDRGLKGFVSYGDIKKGQAAKLDVAAQTVKNVTRTINLNREHRVAQAIANPENHGAKLALSGSSQFSNNASEPIKIIREIISNMLIEANLLVLPKPIWTAIRSNPSVIKTVYRTTADHGLVKLEDFADVLEINKVIVPNGRVNTQALGLQPKLGAIWGNIVAAIYLDPSLNNTETMGWGFTAQYESREVKRFEKPQTGRKGGYDYQVAEAVQEIVVSKDCGALLTNVLAV